MSSSGGLKPSAAWPQYDVESGVSYASSVSQCEASVQAGFLRKVFGLVAAQLGLTAALSAFFMFYEPMQTFAVQSPAMMIGSFVTSIGFLIACQVYAQSHPTNLYLLAGFTLSMAWGVATTCGAYAAAGFSMAVLEALVLTATATVGLTIYTLRSKQDFSYLGAGLGAGLWVLILGGLMAMFLPGMQLAMAIGGAAIFSLYIVYDVHMIATRLSPDEYISAAISLYLDIVNLFVNLLRIIAELSGGRD
mmetsp:Transcript_10991/g.33918  ORF Transcript_10991/g.33918 Transcript_10991/m.33918 type:complete len:248 (+) Transcript_10991:63-806(+)